MGSKKKHKNRNDEMFYNENMNNNPFGIDPNALMSMLGNIDQNKLNNIMSSLNQNGINMDNLNFDNNNNDENRSNDFNENNSQMNNNQMNNMFNGMGNINPLALLNNLMNQQQNNNNAEENNVKEKSFKDIDNKIKNNIDEENNTRKRRDINPDDPNIEMLLALKKIVNEERSEFIDKTIYLYLNGAYEGVKKNE